MPTRANFEIKFKLKWKTRDDKCECQSPRVVHDPQSKCSVVFQVQQQFPIPIPPPRQTNVSYS